MSFNIKLTGDRRAISAKVQSLADRAPQTGVSQEVATFVSERLAKMADPPYVGSYFALEANGHFDSGGGFATFKFDMFDVALDKDMVLPQKTNP